MNRFIRRFYPVERLPADLQTGLPKHGHVHIELEAALGEPERQNVSGLIGSGRNVHGNLDDVLKHVRALREGR